MSHDSRVGWFLWSMSEAPRSSMQCLLSIKHTVLPLFKSFPTSGQLNAEWLQEVGTAATSSVTKCSTGKVNKRQVACGLLGFLFPLLPSLHLCFLFSRDLGNPFLVDGGFSQASCPCSSRLGPVPGWPGCPRQKEGVGGSRPISHQSCILGPGQE